MARHNVIWASALILLATGCSEQREVTTSSDEAYAFYQQGTAEREKIFWAEAAESFQKAVEADSTFAIAYVELAIARSQSANRAGGKEAIEKAYEYRDNCTELEQLYIDYYHAMFNDQKELTEETLAKMAESYPDEYWPAWLKASRAMSSGDREEAIALYTRALEIAPDRVLSHNNLGYLYLGQGDYDEAIASLQRYVYYAPDQPNPHDSLGEAYEAAGMYDEAMDQFNAALVIKPTFYHASLHLARVLATTGQIERAHVKLARGQEVMSRLGNEKYVFIDRMRIDSVGERWEEVLSTADVVIANTDEDEDNYVSMMINALTFKAFAELLSDRVGDSQKTWDRALTYWDMALEKSGDMEGGKGPRESFEVIEQIMAGYTNWKRGIDYTEHTAKLSVLLDKSSQPPHDLAWWRSDLAELYYEAGEYDKCLEQADKLLPIIPDFPYMNLTAAQANAALDRDARAKEHLRTFLHVMRHADPELPKLKVGRELYSQLTEQ